MSNKKKFFEKGFQSIPHIIATSKRFTHAEIRILLKVFDMMWKDKKTGEFKDTCFPADEYLSYWCNVDKKTIQRLKKKVVKEGLFKIVRRRNNSCIWKLLEIPEDYIREFEEKQKRWDLIKNLKKKIADAMENKNDDELDEYIKNLEEITGRKFKILGRRQKSKDGGQNVSTDGQKVQDDGHKGVTKYTYRSIPNEDIHNYYADNNRVENSIDIINSNNNEDDKNKFFGSNNKINSFPQGINKKLFPLFIKLSSTQKEFISSFQKHYFQKNKIKFNLQQKDINAVQNNDDEDLQKINHLLEYWFPYIKDYSAHRNDWLKKTDGSIAVLLKPDIKAKFIKYAIGKKEIKLSNMKRKLEEEAQQKFMDEVKALFKNVYLQNDEIKKQLNQKIDELNNNENEDNKLLINEEEGYIFGRYNRNVYCENVKCYTLFYQLIKPFLEIPLEEEPIYLDLETGIVKQNEISNKKYKKIQKEYEELTGKKAS